MINTRLDFIKVTGLAVAVLFSGIDLKGALIKFQTGLPDLLLKKDGQHVNSISEWNDGILEKKFMALIISIMSFWLYALQSHFSL